MKSVLATIQRTTHALFKPKVVRWLIYRVKVWNGACAAYANGHEGYFQDKLGTPRTHPGGGEWVQCSHALRASPKFNSNFRSWNSARDCGQCLKAPQTQFVGDNPSIRGRYLTKTSLQISKKFRPFVVIEWDAAGNRDPSSPNSPLTSRDTQYNILACYSARQRLRRPFYSERPLSAEDDLQELASPCGQDAGAVGVYRVIPFPTIHESFTGV